MNSITLFSPAKVNLSFRVLSKREDGYHNIASIVQCVNLGDTLTFTLAQDADVFVCNDSSLTWSSTNLVYRAVALFRKKTELNQCFHIVLEKNIPMQAGLGGGSGNAATTLYALNQLLGTGYADTTLAEWGAELGADVPCFFSLGRVLCEGIGEKLTLLPEQKESYWIIKPKELSLSTPVVYKQCRVHPENFQEPCALFTNDLEEAAFELLPGLKEFKKICFNLGFAQVVMTGSGTAFVCQGTPQKFFLPNILCFPVQTLSRVSGSWYSLS